MNPFSLTRALIAVVAVIGTGTFVASARAGVILNLEQVAPPFSAPDAALTGFTAYQWSLTTDDGALISAIDATFAFPMHQRWGIISSDGVTVPTPFGLPANGRGDSHLTPLLYSTIDSGFLENNNVSPSPLPDGGSDYGIGSYISGTWSHPIQSQSSSAHVAYTVVPNGQDDCKVLIPRLRVV